ncbi:hypothetical protein PISMIDRAFT_25792 [Pisolithus microcarpus 441]|uniref:DUF6532 domain-containing protein n=1 Tax=Pisolithus microcarpus 441 TaxID=765257 RepID=A0A0C9Y2C4_9AGAM|nr:hypothetical protein PISMIDRAFT_25792 [Pisolithus microcarpus 441]
MIEGNTCWHTGHGTGWLGTKSRASSTKTARLTYSSLDKDANSEPSSTLSSVALGSIEFNNDPLSMGRSMDSTVSADHERNKKFRPTSPISQAKAARRNKSTPYVVPQRVLSIEPSYTQRALADAYLPCRESESRGSHKNTFDEVVCRLPKDLVRDALRAQYADCEVTRLRVLTVTWELERLERWQSFHSRSLTYLEEQNDISQESLEYWRNWCNDQGIGSYPQDRETSSHLLESECSTLEHLQMHFKCNENTATSLGIYGSEDLVQPNLKHATDDPSDEDGSSSSDRGVSRTEKPEVAYSSDPEEPPASDPAIFHYDSTSDSDCDSDMSIIQRMTPVTTCLISNYTGYLQLYNRAGSSSVGNFAVDTVCSSTAPMRSIDPSYRTFHSTIQPPQRLVWPTPYPSELGVVQNVRAFGPLRSAEEERGQMMQLGVIQAVNDVAITGPSRRRTPRGRSSMVRPQTETDSPSFYMGELNVQAPQIQSITTQAPPTPTVSEDAKKRIIVEAKRAFRREILTSFPFPSQEALTTLSQTSMDAAIQKIIGVSSMEICSHYKWRVSELLKDYKFLYEQDGHGKFGHSALIELPLVVLWAQPGESLGFQIDEDAFGGILTLAGTAIVSALREYETGKYIAVEFSQKNVGNEVATILKIIDNIRREDSSQYTLLHSRLHNLSLALTNTSSL